MVTDWFDYVALLTMLSGELSIHSDIGLWGARNCAGSPTYKYRPFLLIFNTFCNQFCTLQHIYLLMPQEKSTSGSLGDYPFCSSAGGKACVYCISDVIFAPF
jgi:hypothetical protein